MKKTAALILLVMLLINPSIVFAGKKTLTGYIYDTDISVQATDTDPNPSQPGYYAIYAAGSGALTVTDKMNVSGHIYSGGTLKIAESTVIGTSESPKNVIAKGNIEIYDGAHITGNVCSATGSVVLYADGVIVDGSIDASSYVDLGSGDTVGGKVNAGSYVVLNASNAVVTNDINAGSYVTINSGCFAKNNVYTSDTLTLKSSNSKVTSDVHAGITVVLEYGTAIGGDVYIGNGSISQAYGASTGTVYPNLTTTTDPALSLPTAPSTCPDVVLPNSQSFTAGGTDYTAKSGSPVSLIPGTYGTVSFLWGGVLTLKAGTYQSASDTQYYYFTKIAGGTDSAEKIRLDFSTGDQIIVFSQEGITHSGVVEVCEESCSSEESWKNIKSVDEATVRKLAKKTYWETPGSFNITDKTSETANRQWLGTVLASSTTSTISLPSYVYIVGALATNGSFTMPANPTEVTIIYVLADFAKAHW